MAPVAEPVAKVGGDARVAFRLYRSALWKANARLLASDGWYQSVRKSYAE